MRIENLVSKVLFKAAPMSPTEFQDLEQNMALWFDKRKVAVKAKKDANEPLNLMDKGFDLLDQWYMRALFAMAYIFIIRWVQDLMNPGNPDEEDLHYDDEPRR